ncbi:DNA-binding HxlR family transcriptional regulator [Sporomusaceae bacterium BoRhaA]|uniref:winged helix-turn-helix transcriptional regulator n=1 Tax=Pelorhabdus rhamnosifermentans TaxID=2772457 RepID=UPI001C063C84|nr:helix-turn-helix domain-containing protein [Pelorhabdus rhamnosifermentans]MBU2704087.1 DNA-binding HxlR family transcriptional regulator [Pelorhabdus rhamnosifermentans]
MKNGSIDPLVCPMSYTVSIVGGKWQWVILWLLYNEKVQRYGELKKRLPTISHKILSQQLDSLEYEQLIYREEYPQIPPKVEYSLTEKGKTLIPIVELMAKWGGEHLRTLYSQKQCNLPPASETRTYT